jgi:FemAB-related protein (PEP-CTERM system-associated)
MVMENLYNKEYKFMPYKMVPLSLDNKDMCAKWDDFSMREPNGHHHSTSFLKAIRTSCNHKDRSLYAINEESEIVGVLPLIEMRSMIFGSHLVSLPFFNYGGVLSQCEPVIELLAQGAIELANTLKVDNLQLRFSSEQTCAAMADLSCESHKANMVLTLPEDIKLLGAGNGKKRAKLRSQASLAQRKAEENSVQVTHAFGGIELLNDFYDVFSKHMRDLGTPVYSKSVFSQMLVQFGDKATVTVCYWDGKPASCGFLLALGNRLSIAWASCLKEHNWCSLNTYMYWNIIDFAMKNKFEIFDFGRSTLNEGTYNFKLQWGCVPDICYWYNYSLKKKVESSSPNANSAKSRLAVSVWKKMPLLFTNTMGPTLMKSIP